MVNKVTPSKKIIAFSYNLGLFFFKITTLFTFFNTKHNIEIK